MAGYKKSYAAITIRRATVLYSGSPPIALQNRDNYLITYSYNEKKTYS